MPTKTKLWFNGAELKLDFEVKGYKINQRDRDQCKMSTKYTSAMHDFEFASMYDI